MEITKRYRGTVQSLNVIPFVDILFQLIIFFSLACQFINVDGDSLPVNVPDGCKFAQSTAEPACRTATVTVMKNTGDKVDFVVGSEKIAASNYGDVVKKIAELIDSQLKDLPADKKVVTLRIDKDVCFADAQYALAAVSASTATDIQLAALKDKRPASQ